MGNAILKEKNPKEHQSEEIRTSQLAHIKKQKCAISKCLHGINLSVAGIPYSVYLSYDILLTHHT